MATLLRRLPLNIKHVGLVRLAGIIKIAYVISRYAMRNIAAPDELPVVKTSDSGAHGALYFDGQ
ncbi:hypothetical protein LPB67_03635 [Undibacterium sp. Jales W-56]|uniref:hypothetical protein n=1 Tax=Undibacterium sp. Jales W-56 TaxID=2897325 RepID=UPI0021D24DAD|nr:hypothetical protein [Undibacterium sp. Jales W-56]MCU6432870.1 hypothetical protein [Undibacterium sp. Jales W-56]